jgi:hypothetical protein
MAGQQQTFDLFKRCAAAQGRIVCAAQEIAGGIDIGVQRSTTHLTAKRLLVGWLG